jgi:hypothetical protein
MPAINIRHFNEKTNTFKDNSNAINNTVEPVLFLIAPLTTETYINATNTIAAKKTIDKSILDRNKFIITKYITRRGIPITNRVFVLFFIPSLLL